MDWQDVTSVSALYTACQHKQFHPARAHPRAGHDTVRVFYRRPHLMFRRMKVFNVCDKAAVLGRATK